VKANNPAGSSAPSNAVEVVARDQYVVDEMLDFSKILSHSEKLTLESANARPYKEDPHRLKGGAGDWLIYEVSGQLQSARVFTLAENDQKILEFYISTDNKTYSPLVPFVSKYPTGINLYGYKLPVEFRVEAEKLNARYLKIVFADDLQISRVDLRF